MSIASAAERAAVDVQYAIHGQAGTYTAAPAAPTPVTVILSQHDPTMRFGQTEVQSPGFRALVRTSEVPNAVEGHTLTVGTITHTVLGATRDPHGLELSLDLDPSGA